MQLPHYYLHKAPYLLILGFHGAFGVDSLHVVLHCMNVGYVAGVSEAHVASISRDSMYHQNVGGTTPLRMVYGTQE